MSKFSYYLLVTIKGIGMGAANIIPGVSGGTIAFLTGIYQDLIDGIKACDFKALKLLFTGHIKEFSKKINAPFLLCVVLGIIISTFSLAKLMTYFMIEYPNQLWAFFFGLVIVSAIYILKEIKKWRLGEVVSLIVGVAIGVAICLISPSETTNSLWFIFVCGAVSICAMILPGISGSFILLIMGKYFYVLSALDNIVHAITGDAVANVGNSVLILIVFIIGALIGIIAFSHLLSWLMKKFYTQVICLLSGIMIGSLLKVWPWQLMLENGTSRPIAPDGNIVSSIIFAVIGIVTVLILEFMANRSKKSK